MWIGQWIYVKGEKFTLAELLGDPGIAQQYAERRC